MWLVLLLAILLSGCGDTDSSTVRSGTIDDDLFLTGTSLDVRATVAGDAFLGGAWVDVDSQIADNLIAAGGIANIGGRVDGDLIIGAGILDLRAAVGDNLVAVGGVVRVDSPVEGKLFVAAGRLRIGRGADVAGDAHLAAGSAEVAGLIGGDATIAAGSVVLRGRIGGDVEVTAFSLELTDGAVIEGDLVFRGPEAPEIASGATVTGRVEHRFETEPEQQPAAAGPEDWPPVFWLLITLGLGLLLDIVLPHYLHDAGRRLVSQPFSCFALGLAILITTPVLIVVLIISILGLAIGIAGIAAYGALLLLGPVVALYGFNDFVLARLAPGALATPVRRRLAFVAALLLLTLMGWLPYVGMPLLWVVTVFGLGAATWQLYESVRADEPARPIAH